MAGLPTVRARTNTKEDELVQGRKGGIEASAAKCSGLMSSHQAAELGVKRGRGRSGKRRERENADVERWWERSRRLTRRRDGKYLYRNKEEWVE